MARTRTIVAAVLLLLGVVATEGVAGSPTHGATQPDPRTAKAVALLREALAISRKLPDAEARTNALREVFFSWAAVDLERALSTARRLPRSQRRTALRGAADALVFTDTKRGIAFAKRIGYGFEDTYRITATGATLARVSPKDGVAFTHRWIEEREAVAERAVATVLVARDPKGAPAFVRSQPAPHAEQRGALFDSVLEALARTDGARAMALAEAIPNKPGRDGAMRTVVSAIAEVDPERALKLLPRLHDPGAAKWVPAEIAQGFARRDLARALRLARSLGEAAREEALAGIGCEIAGTDPDAALRIMAEIPKSSGWLRDDLAYRVAVSLEKTAPPNAPQLARQIVDVCDGYWAALYPAVRIIAKADLEAALDLATTHPALADKVRGAVAQMLAQDDPARAQSIARQIPGEVPRSEALQLIAEARAQVDPADAISIAETITEKYSRSDALAAIARSLASKDLTAAVAVSKKIPDDSTRAYTLCALALKSVGRKLPEPHSLPS